MKKRKIITSVLLVLLLAFSPLAGCGGKGDKTPVITDPVGAFDIGAPEDVTFSVDLKKKSIEKITRGKTDLAATSYAVSENSLTLKKEYLCTLTTGEHNFTLVTAGGNAAFCVTVTNSKQPVAGRGIYDWAFPEDVGIEVDFKGEALIKVEDKQRNAQLKKDVDFTYADGATQLVLMKGGYIEKLSLGETVLTITTAKGSVDCILEVIDRSVTPDATNFKIPDRTGANLSFALDTKGFPIESVKLDGKLLAEGEEYTATETQVTVSGRVISSLRAGIYGLEITMGNPQKTVVGYSLGSYGIEGQAHLPGWIGDYSKINNFERFAVGDSIIGGGDNPIFPNTLDPSSSNEIVSGADAISGEKSIKFYPSQGANAGSTQACTFFGNKGFVKNTLYQIKAKVRMNGKQSLVFKFEKATGASSGENAFRINNNASNEGSVDASWTKDKRSKAEYNRDGKYWDVSVFAFTDVTDDVFLLMTTDCDVSHSITIDDLVILETPMSLRPSAPLNITGENVYSKGDIALTLGADKAYGLSEVSNGEEKLIKDTDYVYNAATRVLTLKDSYLSKAQFPLTLTFVCNVIDTPLGETVKVDTDFIVYELIPNAGTTGIVNYQSTGATGTGARFPIVLANHKIDSVDVTDIDKTDSDKTQADIPNTAYSYDEGNSRLTINHSFIKDTLGKAGRYKFTVHISRSDGSDPKTLEYILNYRVFSEFLVSYFGSSGGIPPHYDNKNGIVADSEDFGGKALSYNSSKLQIAVSTLTAFDGKITANDTVMIKMRVKLTDAAKTDLRIFLGNTTEILSWNKNGSGQWSGAENKFDVVSLGYGYYDICVYNKGVDPTVEVKVNGSAVIGDISIFKANAVA